MAVRIRVYPQNGAGMLGGAGLYGGAGMYGAAPLMQQQLQNEKKTGALRLEYERALWGERMKTVQLQTAMQYAGGAGYGGYPMGGAMPYGVGAPLLGAMVPGAIPGGFGMVPGMGMGMGMGGLLGGRGQSNLTSQAGNGTQTVANTNHYNNVVWNQTPAFGGGFPFGGGGGGFLSGMLGALI